VRTFALQIVGALVVGTLLLGIGFYTGRSTAPQDDRLAPPDTDSVDARRPTLQWDPVWPEVVTVYDTIRAESLVRDTMWLPSDFEVAGCFQGEPLRKETPILGPTRYRTTYWDPHARRYKQKTYEAGRPRWALWPETEVRTTPWGLQAHLAAGLRWRSWTVTAGYAFARKRRGVTVGLRWRPVRVTW